MQASNIIEIFWLIFLGYWIINWRSVKPAQETAWRAPGLRWKLLWIVVITILISQFHFHIDEFHFFETNPKPITVLDIVGIVITFSGLAIAILARKTLADNWSSDVELKKNHKLITNGVYQYVRHPIYTGILCMGLGTILVEQSLFVILFYVITTAFLIFKMKKEEKLLLKHFSKDYQAYMKKTKALIPFIY